MFCSKCGKELKEGARFCTSCGEPVQKQEMSYEQEVPAKMQETNPSLQSTNTITTQLEKNKKQGIMWLVILLVVLVFIAIGCLAFIIYIQKNDNNDFKKNEDIEQVKEDTETDREGEIDSPLSEEATGETQEVDVVEIDYLEQAQEAYTSNDYALALQYCGMALQADRLCEEAYLLESDIYLRQQEIEQAASILNEGIVVTGSSTLEYKKEQLLMDVVTISCSQYNSLGTLICEVEYDAYGNAIRYSSYSDGKNISSIEECEYDSWGNNVSLSHYNSSMALEWQELYDYNSEGYMTRCTHYTSKNKKEWIDLYSYDNEGRKIETTRYNADGSLSWWDEYTYTSDERIIKTAHPSTGETVVIQCTAAFDQLGNQTEYIEYNASGTCIYAWQKEYNSLGDVTKYIYGDSEINYIYDYIY